MTQTLLGKLTLGQLCQRVGLARSSVLHYESLGLLAPSGRSAAGYRLYGAAELERLQTIRRLREAGLTLMDIHALFAARTAPRGQRGAAPAELLEKRLLGLCQTVERIRVQQRMLACLLATPAFHQRPGHWNKARWVTLLRRAGFDEADMHRWHVEFERDSPEDHTAFLQSLGLKPAEVAEIRPWSRIELGDGEAATDARTIHP